MITSCIYDFNWKLAIIPLACLIIFVVIAFGVLPYCGLVTFYYNYFIYLSQFFTFFAAIDIIYFLLKSENVTYAMKYSFLAFITILFILIWYFVVSNTYVYRNHSVFLVCANIAYDACSYALLSIANLACNTPESSFFALYLLGGAFFVRILLYSSKFSTLFGSLVLCLMAKILRSSTIRLQNCLRPLNRDDIIRYEMKSLIMMIINYISIFVAPVIYYSMFKHKLGFSFYTIEDLKKANLNVRDIFANFVAQLVFEISGDTICIIIEWRKHRIHTMNA